MQVELPERVRLGAFELDLRAGELRKGARKILLQEQPFQVLRMLVERRGQVLTRDEIKKKLWPNDTVVEFEHSIQAAISKLRQALGDSADRRNVSQCQQHAKETECFRVQKGNSGLIPSDM